MARTLPAYEMDATTGQTGIYLVDPATPNDRAPFLNPDAYARFILFHSGMQFMRVAYDRTVTFTFADGAGTSGYTKEWALPAHNLGKIPIALAVIGSAMFAAGHPIQVGASASRTLSLKLTTSTVSISEVVRKYFQAPLPAITRAVRVIMFDTLANEIGAEPFTFDMEAKTVKFGYGRFSNTGPSLIKAAKSGAGIQFYMPKPGPTLDTDNGAIKHVGPDGVAITAPGYGGTFAGSGGWPIKI